MDGVDLGIEGITGAAEIGRGGFAAVYRAVQPDFRRDVAVKIIILPALDDAARNRFRRECQAIGRLSGHPNIVAVHQSGFTKAGLPHLIMDYVPNGSLEDLVERSGPLPWDVAATVGARIARTLEFAHHHGVLHRDVKPANILVSSFGEPLLADFGIAWAIDSSRHSATALTSGTPSYAPPEAWTDSDPTPASDVYSLGATLHALITGAPPFVSDSGNILRVIAMVAQETARDLRPLGVPDAVNTAIEWAMAKDPAERPASAEAFAEVLDAALAEAAPLAPPGRKLDLAAIVARSAPAASRGPGGRTYIRSFDLASAPTMPAAAGAPAEADPSAVAATIQAAGPAGAGAPAEADPSAVAATIQAAGPAGAGSAADPSAVAATIQAAGPAGAAEDVPAPPAPIMEAPDPAPRPPAAPAPAPIAASAPAVEAPFPPSPAAGDFAPAASAPRGVGRRALVVGVLVVVVVIALIAAAIAFWPAKKQRISAGPAGFRGPAGVAVDGSGNAFVADNNNGRIVKVTPGGAVTTFAGALGRSSGDSGDGGPAAAAVLHSPQAVAFDPAGDLFIVESGDIRKVTPAGTITTLPVHVPGVGQPNQISAQAIVVAPDNSLVVSTGTDVVRINTDGSIVDLAGTGNASYGGDGKPASQASFNNALGLVYGPSGELFIADSANNRVRKIGKDGTVTTVAGPGGANLGDGGPAIDAAISFPTGIVFDSQGNLYIVENGGNRIRRVDAASGVIQTIAGSLGGSSGFAGDGGPAKAALFSSPVQLVISPTGDFYVTDQGNNRLRRITPAAVISTIA